MDEQAIKRLVGRRHPEFAVQAPHWRFCGLSFRGGREWLSPENVFRYYKEGRKDYDDRLARTYRANHVRRVVETVNQYLFRQAVVREAAEAPAAVAAFWRDPTGKGTGDMDALAKTLDEWLSVYGLFYAVVDNVPFASTSDGAASEADAARSAPYCYLVPPQDVLDVAYGPDGRIGWLTIAEARRDDADPFASSGAVMTDVRLWTREAWMVFRQPRVGEDVPYELAEAGPNPIGEVPVVPVRCDGGECPYEAPALVGDIAYMDRALVNYGSALDEIIYGQTFSQLAIPASGMLPGSREYDASIPAARNRVFLYDNSDGKAAPHYLSPDASQAGLVLQCMQVLMRTIYACTGTDNDANSQSASTGKSYASGVVRAFDHASIENLLSAKARALEGVEAQLGRLVMLWDGEAGAAAADVAPHVKYPTKFDVRGLQEELAIALAMSTIQAPAELMQAQLKGLVDKMLPGLPEDDRKKLLKAIDKWQTAPDFQRQQANKELAVKEKAATPEPASALPAGNG